MGLLRMAARTAVVAGTATAVSGRVQRRQAARYDQQDAAAVRRSSSSSTSSRRHRRLRRTTRPTQLQNLAQLHTQGVLTDEEFAAAKAKILGI